MEPSQGYESLAEELVACNSFVGLCNLINVSPKALNKAISNTKYQTFSIPKKLGGKRKIENPNEDLIAVQRQLSIFLNQLYKPYVPKCAHGYIPKQIVDDRRDIFSNATAHLHCQYLYNIDALDFFYSITGDKILKAIGKIAGTIDQEIANAILKLVTYKDRLPMGAPTSPVLSNIAAIELDNALLELAYKNGMIYSRYVDDLSFSSSSNPITTEQQQEIKLTVNKLGFDLNDNKSKLFGPEDEKSITGIILNDQKFDITDELLNDLLDNIEKFRNLRMTFQHLKMLGRQVKENEKMQYGAYKSSIKGQLEFAERVLGADHPKFHQLQSLFILAESQNFYIEKIMYV